MRKLNFLWAVILFIFGAALANAQGGNAVVTVTRTILSPEEIVHTVLYGSTRQIEEITAQLTTTATRIQMNMAQATRSLPAEVSNVVPNGLNVPAVTIPPVNDPIPPAPITPKQVLFIKSVFRALPKGQEDAHAHSGFVFKTTYQGKEEIFGVIAQHAVPIKNGHGKLGETFTARVLKDGKETDIPAEIVQMSAPTLPDIALVKFRPEDEALLTPLTLSPQDPRPGAHLQLVGFATEQLTFMSNIPLLENSLISLRFPMVGDPDILPGLCGSPLLNSAGEVVGTVTGAVRRKIAPTFHTGYATRNLYLQTLVAAYHGDTANATFPFILDGKKIVDLRPEEFISHVTLKDEKGKTVFSKSIEKKFPYSAIAEHLPNAQYLELYIEKVWWSGSALIEESNLSDARYVAYDLREEEVITDRPHRTY